MQHNFKDISGKKYGKLQVLKYSHTDKNKRGATFWVCKCLACGKTKTLIKTALLGKRIKSCGCLKYKRKPKISRKEYANNQIMVSYKKSATKRNISWNLNKETFLKLIQLNCHYCGSPPSNLYRHKKCYFKYNGLDRIKNNIGYDKNNVVTCCINCNRAKNNLSYNNFMKYIAEIKKFPISINSIVVNKLWGKEFILINNDKYCLKILEIKPQYQCSLHYHNIKQETFVVLNGKIKLEFDGNVNKMTIGDTKLILPKVHHRFSTKNGALLLEISTHHSDDDVVRIEESKKNK